MGGTPSGHTARNIGISNAQPNNWWINRETFPHQRQQRPLSPSSSFSTATPDPLFEVLSRAHNQMSIYTPSTTASLTTPAPTVMEEQPAAPRPRSSSSPPSPEQRFGEVGASQQVSPLSFGRASGSPFFSPPPTIRTELVWCTKRENAAESYPALRHVHEGSGRHGVFLLGKTNPGQLLMLPEAETAWDITPFGHSWTQATRVVPPVVGYPEAFVAALLQVILEGRLMNGNRMSWSHWIQHYPPSPSHVYALMHCRACSLVRRLPLFALMSAPSEVATFTCAGVSRQCEVPDSDVCPWVAWEVAPPLVYTLTNEPADVANSSIAVPSDPPASSPSSRRRSSRSSLEHPPSRSIVSDPRPCTTIVPRERSNSRRVGITRSSRTPPRSPREVKRERPTRSYIPFPTQTTTTRIPIPFPFIFPL